MSLKPFGELSPPYSTIVADPPWHYSRGGSRSHPSGLKGAGLPVPPPPYSMMTLTEIADLPVGALADRDSHLYVWTTNAYLRATYQIAEAWGFRPSQLLTWCKPPSGLGPGGAFANTTEFVLYCRRGSLPCQQRIASTWWQWPRRGHSQKPPEFLDVVERVSPGPYVELFAREPRLGWDSWGKGYESKVSA